MPSNNKNLRKALKSYIEGNLHTVLGSDTIYLVTLNRKHELSAEDTWKTAVDFRTKVIHIAREKLDAVVAICSIEEHSGAHKKKKKAVVVEEEPPGEDLEAEEEEAPRKACHHHLLLVLSRHVDGQRRNVKEVMGNFTESCSDVMVTTPGRSGMWQNEVKFKYVLKDHRVAAVDELLGGAKSVSVHVKEGYDAWAMFFNQLEKHGLNSDWLEVRLAPQEFAGVPTFGVPMSDKELERHTLASHLRSRCRNAAQVLEELNRLVDQPCWSTSVVRHSNWVTLTLRTLPSLFIGKEAARPPPVQKTDMPIIKRILCNSFGSLTDDTCVQLCAYLHTMFRPRVPRQRVPFLIGPTQCGKSTIADVMRSCFQPNEIAEVVMEDKPFALLPGCKVLIQDEFSSALCKCSIMKKFLEGGPLSITAKNRDPVIIDWHAPMLLTGQDRINYNVSYDSQQAIDSRVEYFYMKSLPAADVSLDARVQVLEERDCFLLFCKECHDAYVARQGRFV